MPVLSWLSVETKTGLVIADLPDLSVESVKSSLGRYESCPMSLPLPTAPESWERAVLPLGANMILLQDGEPVWGGMVTEVPRTEGDTLEIPTATIESYFDRRYVGDETFTQMGQNDILVYLVNKYAADGPNGGIPIRVEVVNGGAGQLRDHTYKDVDDKTLYSVLTDMAGWDGGPQWTVGWEHQSDPERYTPVFYVGDRIGTTVTAGLAPAATFEMPGPVTQFQRLTSYASGKGANAVKATSSSDGDVRPESDLIVTPDPDRPTVELRFTPSTSITDTVTLNGYATAAAKAVAAGTVSLSLSAAIGAKGCPKLGLDWWIGDDIGFSIGGLEDDPRKHTVKDVFVDTFTDLFDAFMQVLTNPNGRNTVPAFPGGYRGVARCIGWELTLGNTPTITPTLTIGAN